MFPRVEHLVVAVTSVGSVAAASSFRHLRSLSLTLAPPAIFANVDFELRLLLKAWPRLETLSLKYCGGLQLSALARLCPQIRRLRLICCQASKHDISVHAAAFPNIESVDLTTVLLKPAYEAFFLATCGRLRSLRLGDDGNAKEFLHLCTERSRGRISFPRLEELTLATCWTVRQLGLQPEDLHHVLDALPSLLRLKTDSYDLRLFFENYCRPRGRVSLSWCECVYCAVHDQFRERRQDFRTKFIVPSEKNYWSASGNP
ncbi:hypothetical protein V5799_011031 [Amblyomma americanum]|uniref:Uncharacterized protein n=1 Tax=Amblyomma americanum TaxID=6943 RepID=A0AAQ4EI51_AMBAM